MRASLVVWCVIAALVIGGPATIIGAEPDVAALIAASRKATSEGPPLTLSNGQSFTGRYLVPVTPPTAQFGPPPNWPAPIPAQPGRVLQIPEDERPIAIQPISNGRLLLGTGTALYLLDSNSTAPAQKIRTVGARQILPNEDGSKLLITTTSEPSAMILDAETLETESALKMEKKGALAWWGESVGEILLTREAVDFRGDSEKRIFLLVTRRTVEDSRETDLGWPLDFFSSAGTIAPLGVSWGVKSRAWQVNPMPGELLALDGGKIKGPLTTTDRWADISPAGGRDGMLYWVRTRERGSNTGRLMMRDAREADTPARQLTAEPAWAVGVSADGARIAWITAPSLYGPWNVRTATKDELSRVDSRAMGAADARIDALWTSAAQKLRAEFATTSAGRSVTGDGPTMALSEAPSWEVLETMGTRLRELLSEEFDLPPMTEKDDAFARADFILAHGTGFIREEPPEILAVAGFFIQEARRRNVGTTLPGAVDATLASSVEVWAWSDGLTCLLASPCRIARDRIRSELRLTEVFDRLRSNPTLPVFHVDGFDVPTRLLAAKFLAGIAGLAETEPQREDAARALEAFPDCDICAEALADRASDEGHPEQALKGATVLATRHPPSAEAFVLLAEALLANGRQDDARAAMEWAVKIDPFDAMIAMRATTLWIVLADAARARAEYSRLIVLDGAESFEEALASRKRMIEALESKTP